MSQLTHKPTCIVRRLTVLRQQSVQFVVARVDAGLAQIGGPTPPWRSFQSTAAATAVR